MRSSGGAVSALTRAQLEEEVDTMDRVTPLAVLLALVTLLCVGCGAGQAPGPTAVPTAPEATVPPTEATAAPTAAAPTVGAADTPLAATVAAGVTPQPTALPTQTTPPPSPTALLQLSLSTTAFAPGGDIPVKHSCFGENLSPPLAWTGVPAETESLALVVDDPDSQPAGFVHWVVYNLPPTATGLPEGLPAEGMLGDGTIQGKSDFAPFEGQTFPSGAAINGVGYAGPCPPGRHRYVFTLYALDARLELPAEATAAEVLAAVQGHILTQALLAGAFTPPQ